MTMHVEVHVDAPALRRGLAIVSDGDGLIIEGGPSRQRFTGAAARDLLPRLLPLLDGSSTRAALCEQLTLHESQLDQVLALLADRGLLGSDAPTPGDATDDYLSRTAPTGDGYRSVQEIRRDLGEQTVLIAAPPSIRDDIMADLKATGIGTVGLLGDDPPHRGSLVIVYDDGRSLEHVVDQCANHGVTVLRCAVRGDVAEVGPRFLAGKTPCVECFRRGYDEAFPAHTDTSAATLHMLAALVGGDVLATHRVGTSVAPHAMRRVDVAALAEDRYVVAPEPDCPYCGVGGERRDEATEIFGEYEWQMQATPPESAAAGDASPPTADQRFYQTDYATSPRRALAELPDDALGSLLRWTVGPRDDGTGKRWAPTGGNLGSVELFVLTEQPWADLHGTVFKYDADSREIIATRSDRVPLPSMLAETGLATDGLYAAVVFCGALWRLVPKYGLFACRLTHLDTGCATAQFALLAQESGFDVRYARGWTGQLTQSLELVERREIVTAVVGLYRGGTD
jgi:SagB-type dehydrogenase family enzyme